MDPTFEPELRLETRNAVTVVTMNRPEVKNAVDERLHAALDGVFHHVAKDPDVRAIVLTGAGDAFSAGGDVAWIEELQSDPAARLLSNDGAHRIVTSIISCRLPVVAAVNGPAVGLGCTLAVACDLVYLAESAFLCDPHVSIGLTAGDGGAALWPLTTSVVKAKERLFFGSRVPSHEAVELGLANAVLPDAELLDRTVAIAERLAALPPLAVQTTKRAMAIHTLRSIAGVFEYSLAAEYQTFDTPEHRAIFARNTAK